MQSLLGKNVCNIAIDLDKVYVTHNSVVNEKIVKKSKFMSLDNFIASIKNINTSMSTPILPSNCFAYNKSGNISKFFLFSPSQRTQLRFRTGTGPTGVTVYENAWFPSFVLVSSFNGNSMNNSYVYQVDSLITSVVDLQPTTTLYRMPFPNVYHDARICWGYNFGGRGDDASMTMTTRNTGILADIFRTSTFNHDLFSEHWSRISAIVHKNSIEEYFNHLTTVPEWPSSVQEPLNLKLGDIL